MARLEKTIRRLSRDFPFYVFLIGCLPAVHFMETNFRLLQAQDLARPVLLTVLLSGGLLILGALLWRSLWAAGVILAPLVAVIYKGHALGRWPSLALVIASVLLGLWLYRRPAEWPRRLSLPLNMALVVLVGLPLLNVWRAERVETSPRPSAFFESEIPLPPPGATVPRPDIYFLLVDALGQPDFLADHYGLGPEQYTEPLAARGFHVLRHSLANYPQTALSIAATLNLGPIDRILDIPDPTSRDRRVLARVTGNSRVVRALRRLGYRVATFPSGYPLTRMRRADRVLSPFLDPSFVEYYLLEDGVLPLVMPLLGKGPADYSYDMRRGRLNFIFDNLPRAGRDRADDEPWFTFAHILAPHPPFVFGPAGEARRSRAPFGFADGDHWLGLNGADHPDYRRLYADQARWVMHRLAATVDGIIASSSRPKVIIIQGDHGPGSGLKWEQPLATDHDERFGIFNAWYVWDGRELPLYEGMTAINTFPLLFDAFFGATLPRLPDDHWFARMSQPYTLFPVDK